MLPMMRSLMGGGVDISLPNVSYCEDVKDIHYNPYNTVEFYVGEITGTTPQTVEIYTDLNTSVDVQVSEGNKWYTYLLPKDKGLFRISGNTVNKVVVKADISYEATSSYRNYPIIQTSTVEASFKGSNTSNVTLMYEMFSGCRSLTSLDLSGWNTSKVTDMHKMFNFCSGLESLDVSNFDTSKVTSMSGMFNNCSKLTSLDLSNFNTSNVISMSLMFYGCSGLTSLTLSNFDTSNVTYMNQMFSGCIGLSSLTLSNFDTSKVTRMDEMFNGCSGLTSLDLSKWDTSKVTDISRMFNGCSALTSITMKDCSSETIGKIQAQLTKDNITGVEIVTA